MPKRIASKLSSALVIIIITGGALMGVAITQSGTGLLMEASSARLSDESKVATTRLHDIFENVQRDLDFLSRSPSLRRLIDTLEAGDRVGAVETGQAKDRLQEVFDALLVNHPWYTQIRLIGADDQGMELVRVDQVNGETRRMQQSELQNKGHRKYVIESLGKPAGQFYWSAINLNREYGRIAKPYQPVFRVSIQVAGKDSNLFGIVIINLDARRVFDAARGVVSPGLTLYIANSQGDYLYHPDPGRTFGFELGRRYRIQDDIPAATALLEGEVEDMIVEEILFPGATQSVVAHLDLMHAPDGGSEDLLLGLTMQRSVIEKEVNAARRGSAALILPFLLVGTIVVIWLVRVFIAPLERVTREVSLFAPGVRRKRLPEADRQDEVGMLAQAYTRMAERIDHQIDELEEQQQRFQSLFETAPDAIIIIDQSGTMEFVNSSTERLFGYRSNQIIGRDINMLMPEPDRGNHAGYMNRYLQGGEPRIVGIGREVTGLRKDGTTLQLYLSIGEFRLGDKRKFTGILHDISQRKTGTESSDD